MMDKVTMNRVEACAIIAQADKAEKIQGIAASMDGDIHGAAVRYVLGALKAGIRRGTYRTYQDALDAFERAQVGDRGQVLAPMTELERTVRHINYVNAQPTTDWEKALTGNKKIEVKRSHSRNMAKVMGELYVQWIEREEVNTVEYQVDQEEMSQAAQDTERHIRAYISEYVGRLSPTAQKTVHEIVTSAYCVEEIMGGKGGLEAERLRAKVKYLYKGFPASDSLSVREFADIMKRYAA
jgi:hypothetical protein